MIALECFLVIRVEKVKKYPIYKQHDAMDCGPTCLRMISKYYGKGYTLEELRNKTHKSKTGVSFLGISEAAETIGMRSLGAKITFDKLKSEAPLPAILHWRQEHFVVLYDIKKDKALIGDPAHGIIKLSKAEFLKNWTGEASNPNSEGLILLLEATPQFHENKPGKATKRTLWSYVPYLWPHKKLLLQIILGMAIGLGLNLIAPFITQSVVDHGIQNRDINFITLILIGQLVLFLGNTFSSYIQGLLSLHFTTRLNLSLVTDFLIKLLKLPFAFFERRSLGDIMQRMGDHSRIESIISFQTIQTVFSFFNFIIYSFILASYDMTVYLLFMAGTGVYAVWILLFLKKRKELDYKSFGQSSRDSNVLVHLIQGITDIKINNAEKVKRWEWERVKVRQFKISLEQFYVNQLQSVGSGFINKTKNLGVTFLVSMAVVSGDMTIGMMMAVQFMLGQLEAPISQVISFINSFQDAKIGVERLGEVYDSEEEEVPEDIRINELPSEGSIDLQNISFRYGGENSAMVLNDINLMIPEGRVTAIVGSSGSGKTTLLKLLMKFYDPLGGNIQLGNIPLSNLSHRTWRQHVGVVLQDNFIFSDTIANNIALSENGHIDRHQLQYATEVANIREYIESLPLNYQTKIGQEGQGLSQGQRQRLMIARAVYKNPKYLFFDEATNALDANNEKTIMQNLDRFFTGRTVVVVAHRLSTVKNADQIIVLEHGNIIERGTHAELAANKGAYFELVRNQLELGN